MALRHCSYNPSLDMRLMKAIVSLLLFAVVFSGCISRLRHRDEPMRSELFGREDSVSYWLVGNKVIAQVDDEEFEVTANIACTSTPQTDRRIVIEARDTKGQPVSNTQVHLLFHDYRLPHGPGIIELLTDINGRSEFIDPPEEAYFISLRKEGYAPLIFGVGQPNQKLDISNTRIPPGMYLVTLYSE